MATAASNVQIKLTLKGQDKASGAINKVGRSADGAASKMALLGKAALAAGVGFVAIGAAVSAVKRMAEMAEQAERLRASLEFAGGGRGGFERIIALADKIGGVTAESVGRFSASLRKSGVAGAFTAEQLRKATGAALTMGKTGDDAMTALAMAVENANTRALKSIGIFINNGRVQDAYAKSLGKSTTELTALEQRTAVVNALQEKLNTTTETSSKRHAKLDGALADLSNRMLELKIGISEFNGRPLAAMVRLLASAAAEANKLVKAINQLGGKKVDHLAAGPVVGGGAFGAIARAGGASVLTEKAKARLRGLRTRHAQRGIVGGLASRGSEAIGEARAFFGRLGGVLSQAGGAAQKLAGKIQSFRSTAGQSAAIRKQRERREAGRKRRGRLDAAIAKDPSFGGFIEADKSHEDVIAAGKFAADQARIDADLFRDQFIRESEADRFKAEMHDRDMARQREKTAMYGGVASSITGSIASVMAMFGAQEAAMRVQAGVEAAIAFGKGMVALGSYQYPQAAAFFAGSAALAIQAGMPVKSAAGASGGGGNGGPSSVGASASGGGGRTTIVNFNNGVVLGNPHEVARTIKGAMAVSHGTGF